MWTLGYSPEVERENIKLSIDISDGMRIFCWIWSIWSCPDSQSWPFAARSRKPAPPWSSPSDSHKPEDWTAQIGGYESLKLEIIKGDPSQGLCSSNWSPRFWKIWLLSWKKWFPKIWRNNPRLVFLSKRLRVSVLSLSVTQYKIVLIRKSRGRNRPLAIHATLITTITL